MAADVVDSDEALKKAANKAKKQAKRDKETVAEDDDARKSKKRKSHDEKETDLRSYTEKKHKKSKKDVVKTVAADDKEEKKSKKPSKNLSEEDIDSADGKAARKEKKRLKKEKKEREAADAMKNAEEAKASELDSKMLMEKSSKKARQTETAAKPAASADQWNPDALTGDSARKNKFLRLLGAGKGSGIGSAPKKKQTSDQDIQKVESELERQFAAGIRMKHGGMGKRTGLGM